MQQEVHRVEIVEILGVEERLALHGPERPRRQEAAEPRPAGAVPRQRGDLEAVPGEAEPRRRDEAWRGAGLAGDLPELLMRAHQPRHRVAVGDGEGRQPERGSPVGVLLRMAAAGQESEVRGDRELGEGHGGRARLAGRRPPHAGGASAVERVAYALCMPCAWGVHGGFRAPRPPGPPARAAPRRRRPLGPPSAHVRICAVSQALRIVPDRLARESGEPLPHLSH